MSYYFEKQVNCKNPSTSCRQRNVALELANPTNSFTFNTYAVRNYATSVSL